MDNTRNKLTMLANRYKRLLSKKYNHICLTNGCNEQAILSHSISKSTLKKISEDQHVISPIFNLGVNKSYMSNAIVSEKNVGFKKIGINKASAYKVFCSKCDNSIFANLDNNGILSYRELFLQLYRSVCTKKFQNDVVKKSEIDILNYEFNSNTEFELSSELSIDNLILLSEDLLIDFPDFDQKIEVPPGHTMVSEAYSDNVDLRVSFIHKKLPQYFNFSLQNCVHLTLDGENHYCIFILIPHSDHSSLTIFCHKNAKEQFLYYMRDEFKTLNLLESILMLDSEFYLPPSVLSEWSEEKKNLIETDYYFVNERKFLQEYEVSIFDDLRKIVCEKFNGESGIYTNDEKSTLLNKEYQKLYNLPERPSFRDRIKDIEIYNREQRIKKFDLSKKKTQQNV